MMQNQQGAALIIVLVLLSVSLVISMSGMNAALVDERLAGNYRASVQAQMNSDSMMSEMHSSIIEDRDESFNKLQSDGEEEKEKVYTWDEIVALLNIMSKLDNTDKLKVEVRFQGDEITIKTQDDGTNNNAVWQTVATYQRRDDGGSGENGGSNNGGGSGDSEGETVAPFDSAVISCQNTTLKGSAKIKGGLVAGNDVVVDGNPAAPDSVFAGGEIIAPNWWLNQNSQVVENYQDSSDGYEFTEVCDSLGILEDDANGRSYFEEIAAALNVVSASQWLQEQGLDYYFEENNENFTLTGGRGNQDASVSFLGFSGNEISLRIDKSLKTSGRLNRLVIDGTVNLFIDGDFDLGNNTSLEVSSGAVLNLYVSGRVTLSAGSNLALGSEDFMRQDTSGVQRPAVSIYSTYQQSGNQSGVTIGGSNNTYAAIYAPGSDVDIRGSGALYGSLRARNVTIFGSGSLEYVSELLDYKVSGSRGSSNSAPETGNEAGWQLVDWQ
jgi:hypothetical protein|tara:strand:- start:228 stop:1712 length:1485 start_codon:yes stop_codon:yes gene_type:complete